MERKGGGAVEYEAAAMEVDDDREFGARRERVGLEGADESTSAGVEWEILRDGEFGA